MKTKERLICQECKNGSLYFDGKGRQKGGQPMFYQYICKTCQAESWLEVNPESVEMDGGILNEN